MQKEELNGMECPAVRGQQVDVTSELLQLHRRELRHEDDDGDERGQEMR